MTSFAQMEKIVEAHLVWLWNNAEAEMGIKSNFNAIVSGNKHNGMAYQDPYHSGVLNAICKKRQLDAALTHVNQHTLGLLLANFGECYSFPAGILHVFNKEQHISLAPTACYLWNGSHKDLVKLAQLKMQKKINLEDGIKLMTFVLRVKQEYQQAIQTIYPLLKDIQ